MTRGLGVRMPSAGDLAVAWASGVFYVVLFCFVFWCIGKEGGIERDREILIISLCIIIIINVFITLLIVGNIIR